MRTIPVVLLIVGLSFIFTWLFNHSGGSLVPPLLFHVAQNREEAFEVVFPSIVGSDWETIAALGLLVLPVIAAVLVARQTAEHSIGQEDYPYPLDYLRGEWAVRPAGSGQTEVTVPFELRPSPGPAGSAFAAAMTTGARPLLRRVMNGWQELVAVDPPRPMPRCRSSAGPPIHGTPPDRDRNRLLISRWLIVARGCAAYAGGALPGVTSPVSYATTTS